MKIINWSKLNGTTYKGYVIGAPGHNPNYTAYNITIYDLNRGFSGSSNTNIWMDMKYIANQFQLTLHFIDINGKVAERIEILTYDNVKTMADFIKSYEVLIDWYEFKKRK